MTIRFSFLSFGKSHKFQIEFYTNTPPANTTKNDNKQSSGDLYLGHNGAVVPYYPRKYVPKYQLNGLFGLTRAEGACNFAWRNLDKGAQWVTTKEANGALQAC